jgi:hypothetical protein
MFLFPKRLYRAFVRGRHCTNLYRDGFPESELPNKTLDWLRRGLGLNEIDMPVTPGDKLAFALWCITGALYHAAWLAAGVAILCWIVMHLWK